MSLQNVELSACTKDSIKQRMVQNAFGLVRKSLHTTCPKITAAIDAAMVAVWTSMPHCHSLGILASVFPLPVLCCRRVPVAIDGARFKFGEKILGNE